MMYLALSILMILPLTKVMFSIHKQLTHIPIFHRTSTTSATTITRFTTNPTSVYLQPCFTSPSQCILSTPALRQPALLAPVCPPGSRRPGKRPPAATRPPGFHPPGRSASALQRSCCPCILDMTLPPVSGGHSSHARTRSAPARAAVTNGHLVKCSPWC